MSEIAMNSETIEASKELVQAAKKMVYGGWSEKAVLKFLKDELEEAVHLTYRKKRFIRDLHAFIDHLNGVSTKVIVAEHGDKHADINRSIKRGIYILRQVLQPIAEDKLRGFYEVGIRKEDKDFWEKRAEDAIDLMESQTYLNALEREKSADIPR
jgi:CO dehydrogenase/acetyl-CoA synthase gamma subunit (corrinoid Fe-S protein)